MKETERMISLEELKKINGVGPKMMERISTHLESLNNNETYISEYNSNKPLDLNKIYLGDCLDLMNGIPDKSIDMILTDPPYGMSFRSDYRKKKYDKIKNDNTLNWIDNFISNSYRVLKDDSTLYLFCSWHNIDVFKKAIEKKFKLKNMIVWVKNNTGMGDLKGSFAPKHELILFAQKGRRLNEGFRHPDVLNFNKTNNVFHPTEKPIDLLELLIKNSSKENDIIFDPFMGSGSTGVACKNINRKFIGIELDETYFNIAKERIAESLRSRE